MYNTNNISNRLWVFSVLSSYCVESLLYVNVNFTARCLLKDEDSDGSFFTIGTNCSEHLSGSSFIATELQVFG
jgi:hypothetical protein